MSNSWNVTPTEAIAIQKQLRPQIRIQKLSKTVPKIRLIGGADLSFNRFDPTLYAGIIVLNYETLEPVAYSLIKTQSTFPYIPGLLSFREIPALLQAWEQLTIKPDVLVVDGQGFAHPRRMGIATHFGLVTGVPTIGCAKSPLVSDFQEPAETPSSMSPIYHQEKDQPKEQVGIALRTKVRAKPIYISPGNLTDFDDALAILQHCDKGYRIPEPTRQAHFLVNKFRRGELAEGMHVITEKEIGELHKKEKDKDKRSVSAGQLDFSQV